MLRVAESVDAYRVRRQQLLSGVSARLREVGIDAAFGELRGYYDLYGAVPEGLTGLIVRQPGDPGQMQVTVVGAHRTAPPGEGGLSADRRLWVRDVDIRYELDGDDEVVFEVSTLEGTGDGPGNPPAIWAPRQLTRDGEAAVDAIRLWYGYRDSWRTTPPTARPDRRRAARMREVAARRAAAEAARIRLTVDTSAVPAPHRPRLTEDLARLDPAQLCFHFPRDRQGRYVKSAVVALSAYHDAPLTKRGPWLAVVVDGDTLVVGVLPLIGANQDHRWDASPWLWRTGHGDATVEERWQVPDAERARPAVDLLDRNAVADALTLCGVDVAPDIAALLAGYPISYQHARYTDTWVGRLYEQLPTCAPWRLAHAYRVCEAQRQAGRRRPAAPEPIPLFGLKGLNQQAKPMLAIGTRDGVPRLTMVWTASNARVPRTLWERPADLTAALVPR